MGFTIGFWGAYSYPGGGNTYSENDIFASYTLTTDKAGSFSVLYTDYYIPSLGIPFGYYQNNGGAHVLEGGVSYTGPEIFPVNVTGYYNFYNDTDKSVYLQAGYPLTIGDATLTPAVGFVPAPYLARVNETTCADCEFCMTACPYVAIDISYLVFGASLTL